MTLVCWPEESKDKGVFVAFQCNSADSTQQPSDNDSSTFQRQPQAGDGKTVLWLKCNIQVPGAMTTTLV